MTSHSLRCVSVALGSRWQRETPVSGCAQVEIDPFPGVLLACIRELDRRGKVNNNELSEFSEQKRKPVCVR
jgi:hypothetical protein